MKTIPVSFLVAGMLLPAVCLAQPQEPPKGPPVDDQDGRPGPQRPFVEAWKQADSDHDGFISKEEFGSMPRIRNLPEEKRDGVFKRLDKDADGKLSRDELVRFGREEQSGRPLKRLWELDSDKSGGISFEEFKKGQFFMKLPPEKQEAVFHRLDTDKDGVITPKDRPEPAFKHPEGKPHPNRPEGKHPDHKDDSEKPDQINRRLDLNGDGALSFEEFRGGPAVKNLSEDEQEKRFELLDRNGDLKISPEDFPRPPSAE